MNNCHSGPPKSSHSEPPQNVWDIWQDCVVLNRDLILNRKLHNCPLRIQDLSLATRTGRYSPDRLGADEVHEERRAMEIEDPEPGGFLEKVQNVFGRTVQLEIGNGQDSRWQWVVLEGRSTKRDCTKEFTACGFWFSLNKGSSAARTEPKPLKKGWYENSCEEG